MRTTSKLLALALTAAMQPAMAGAVFLNFEDVTTTELLNKTYNGVAVSGAAWTATSEACNYGGVPGSVSFVRTSSCGALWLAEDPTSSSPNAPRSLTLTLTEGFINALSFVYSASTDTPNLKVHVYDAAGRELGLGLDGLAGSACSTYVFCNWSQTMSYSFQGTARYVTFTALDQSVLLDDVRFTTPGRLPEPASLALAIGALGALGWARKRSGR